VFIRRHSTAHQVSKNRKLIPSDPFFGLWGGQTFWSTYVSDEFYYLFKELEEVYGWKELADGPYYNRTWLANDNISSYFMRYFNRIPDLIVYVEMYDMLHLQASRPDWKLLRHPWLFMDDVQGDTPALSILIREALMTVEHTLATYPYRIDEEYTKKITTNLNVWSTYSRTWIPHAASPSFFTQYNPNPILKIFLSGAISEIYPYRQLALAMYEKAASNRSMNRIEYLKHPGYGPVTNATQSSVGKSYAKMINRYFAAMTDISVRNYIVAKVFEIPAAGALLLLNSEAIPILARLGWHDNVHYVTYNRTNMETVFADVLNTRYFEKYERIRRTGHKNALQLHTTKRRALFIHNLAMNSYLNG
jgi:hypothetical protein